MEISKPEEQEPDNNQLQAKPQTLSPSSSGRSSLLNSPEFEFWTSFPQPNLHSADELFVDGIILPLCLLPHEEQQQQQHSSDENPQRNLEEEQQNDTPISEQGLKPETEHEPSREIGPEPGSGPESSSSSSAAATTSTTVFSTSKRWRDIFKVGEKKSVNSNNSNGEESKSGVEKEKRKDRKSSSTNSTASSGTNNSAELNINIWPFSRSRSAGNNNGNRPKVPLTRKVSSAPCSRSNSGSESKSRKWPSSPSRGGGIHLGRSSPVWQVRRGLTTTTTTGMHKSSSEPVAVKNADSSKVSNVKKEGSESSRWSKSRLGGGSGGGGGGGGGSNGGVSGLNLNVQMCMGYRQNSICRSDEHRSSLLVSGAGAEQSCSGGAAAASTGGNGVKMFNIRTLFSSKKVY
ncbi:hypothetical protein MKW94_005130 [Papaver nudicaule]|uniref:Uncharacterized protein n=1 Tax=Papaver nudicaule TaxID=74823 RepID=A0AA41S3Q1_PAPNU|nr:hypothetical protein [Papaver nudicaule]